ncbi:WxL domain-containing protein [Listeria booriae]|uniref:WxL domain-containing protein n=1 Tax=Listeria booriae TaxID=1552123 RepID=A0A841YL93_9LIST|nr:WxL domain-containing protein [Listeria booriae]MBC1292348.1 WxL domain-containing protein [Listeria booriae]MBC1401181.1 WxL domain-containing protein [Listeria booriae]MBC1616193.1 WxL domain-containing protein [Listeria booriae]MBC1944801.1 WxL domain-containing protein [Listeria booriae]MBC2057632.1 WxL domain-containing protein [Listeria booriae]
MNINKLLLTILATTTAIGVGSTTAFAAEADSATSSAHIKLQQGETTGPVDPIDPSEPGGETGNEGPLTIDNVTPFEFGTHDIESATQTYSITAKNANVQVSDRRGEGQGWTLQVALSTFNDKDDASKVLKGATLAIPQGTLKTTEGNVSEEPTNFAVSLAADGQSSATLMQADEKKGMGTWVDAFASEEVQLTVPAGNFSGDYSATLNWSLIDAPTK